MSSPSNHFECRWHACGQLLAAYLAAQLLALIAICLLSIPAWARLLGALLCRGVVKNMKKRADPDQYGGAPLLGVNGVCIIGHGSSSHVAVTNAIKVACEWSRHDINHIITDYVQRAPEEAVE